MKHIHRTQPGCHTDKNGPVSALAFKDGGAVCYQTFEQAVTHDEGCAGCQRPADKRIIIWNHNLANTYKAEK